MYWVTKRMEETGCDLFIDVHGDEALPYNFIAGNEGIPAWSPRLQKLQVWERDTSMSRVLILSTS